MASVPLMYAEEDMEMGGVKDIENDFAYRNNVHQANIKVRHGFLRKVYLLLFTQLTITTAISLVVMFWPTVRSYVTQNDWLVMSSFIASFICLVALHIKRHESPMNFILLSIFTVVQAYSVAVVVTFFDQLVVLEALLLTVTVLAGLTLFTFQTKRDFSSWGTALFVLLNILLVGLVLQLFFQSTHLELLISISGAVLFSFFIVYDTQMLMKRLSAEEYILATITLYLDIINLFLYILRVLQATRRQ